MKKEFKISRGPLGLYGWSMLTIATLGTLFLALLFAALISGCAVTTGVVYDSYGSVYVEELPGPSPYHRRLRLHNGRPYAVRIVVDCTFGVPSRIDRIVLRESSTDATIFVDGPRWTRGYYGMCDMVGWAPVRPYVY